MPEFEWQFTLVLLTNGIMIGLMYALIALGFVLIYKATDAINFAQGEFVMFAGFLAAGAAEIAGAPLPIASRCRWRWALIYGVISRWPGRWQASSRRWAGWCGARCSASTTSSRWSGSRYSRW